MGDTEYVCGACGARSATSDRVGICPSCKNGFLTPVPAGSTPRANTPRPGASGSASGSSSSSRSGGAESLRKGLVAIVVFGLIVGAITLGPMAWDRIKHPSTPVHGAFVSQHLGVTMSFDKGWRHLRKEDQKQHYEPEQLAGGMALNAQQRAQIGGADLRSSTFFRGGTSAKPREGLFVGVLELQSEQMRQVLSANLLEAAKAGADNVQSSVADWQVTLGDCALESADGYNFARCSGSASGDESSATVVFYLYATGRGVGMVLLISPDPADKAAIQARTLLLSMR